MIEGESQTDYARLLEWFLAEHPPEDTEEVALVSKMAEHFWLAQRAQVLQNDTLRNADYPGGYNYMNRQEQNASSPSACATPPATKEAFTSARRSSKR